MLFGSCTNAHNIDYHEAYIIYGYSVFVGMWKLSGFRCTFKSFTHIHILTSTEENAIQKKLLFQGPMYQSSHIGILNDDSMLQFKVKCSMQQPGPWMLENS